MGICSAGENLELGGGTKDAPAPAPTKRWPDRRFREIDHADCVIKLIADRLLDPSEEDDRAAIASTHACFEFACPVG
jgi:hypothetical protein